MRSAAVCGSQSPGTEPWATARNVGMFQPIFGSRARAGVGVHIRGGSEARMLGDGMTGCIGLHEHTLKGFKARCAEGLTAVGREIGMGLCEWDSPLFVPTWAQSLFPRCSAARACFGELFHFPRAMRDSGHGSQKQRQACKLCVAVSHMPAEHVARGRPTACSSLTHDTQPLAGKEHGIDINNCGLWSRATGCCPELTTLKES